MVAYDGRNGGSKYPRLFTQLTAVRKEFRELTVHKANYEELLNIAERDDAKNLAPARS